MNENDLRQSNWLYRDAELFEAVHGHMSDKIARLVWHEIGKSPPDKIGQLLDVGCGTGRLLRNFAPFCERVVGVDINSGMIDYARTLLPGAEFLRADMRELGEIGVFDVVTCVGSVLLYMHSNDDLLLSLKSLRERVKPDGMLLLGLTDAGGFIGSDAALRKTFKIETPGFSATATATYEFHPDKQLMSRVRVWRTSNGEELKDEGQYRLIFPLELDFFLASAGFTRRRRVSLLDEDVLQPRIFVIAAP